MSLGFLVHVSMVRLLLGRGKILLKHGICTCDHFAVHEQVAPCPGSWFNLSITLQARKEQTMVEMWCKLGVRKTLLVRKDLLDDLAVVNAAIFRDVGIRCLCQGLLKPFETPDCIFILDVKGICFRSNPFFAVLLVDDAAPVSQQL